MAIIVKNPEQIECVRESCRIVAGALELLEQAVRPGVTTRELDVLAYDYITGQDAFPSFKGYRGYPASICASVNNEVIHGIPGLRKLKNGDIVSIDIGAYKNGFHGDATRTFAVGNISDEARNLVDVTRQSFFEGVAHACAGVHLHDISAAVEDCVTAHGYSVVRDYVGHGVGAKLHEEPNIPHYRVRSRGPRLTAGMTLAIEPMVNAGACEIELLDDDWTVVTRDGSLSAHYENTILITDDGCEILTLY